MLEKLELYLDDFIRTSRLPAGRALFQFIAGLPSSHDHKLRSSTAYLKHRTDGALSRLALAVARSSAREIAKSLHTQDSDSIIRAIVAKPHISSQEPGVLIVSFESELRKILRLRRFRELNMDYIICFMPSWHNFMSPELMLYDTSTRNRYYVLPSLFDYVLPLSLLGDHARFLPLHAASWVNHRLYCRAPVKKDIDISMLANFARFKRHWRLFQALSRMPSDLRVCLLGNPHGGRTAADLLREARIFGVQQEIEIHENADQDELRDLLERTRLLCALSHREGSYVGVAEALHADTPVAMFSNAQVGTRAYINPQTGFLLDPHLELANQLLAALDQAKNTSPRKWAQSNISAELNCERLNTKLQHDSIIDGRRWSMHLQPYYRVRFELHYVQSPEREVDEQMSAEYAKLESNYGLTVVRPNPHA